MGYDTKFKGVLRFVHEPSVAQIKALNDLAGEDAREHAADWALTATEARNLSYIDLRVTRSLDGLEWNDETEKTRGMVEAVNLVTRLMRAKWPEFQLTGELKAQGEDSDDRWILRMDEHGVAFKIDDKPTGLKVACPECGHKFRVEPPSPKA